MQEREKPGFSRSREFDDSAREMLAAFELLRGWGIEYREAAIGACGSELLRLAGEDERRREAIESALAVVLRYARKHEDDLRGVATDGDLPIVAHPVSTPLLVPCRSCGGLGCESCSQLREAGWRRATPWQYRTVLDSAVWINGEPWLVVRRFTGGSDVAEIRDGLGYRFDDLGQLWAFSKLIDATPRGILYDVIRRSAPSEPKTIKCRKCNGSGTMDPATGEVCPACDGTGVGGISKAACDTDLSTWWEVARRYPHLDTDALKDEHAEQLQRIRSRGDSFSFRVARAVDPEEIVEWRREAYEVAKEIERCERSGSWRRNHLACKAPGRRCPFRSICAKHDVTLSDRLSFATTENPAALDAWRPRIGVEIGHNMIEKLIYEHGEPR